MSFQCLLGAQARRTYLIIQLSNISHLRTLPSNSKKYLKVVKIPDILNPTRWYSGTAQRRCIHSVMKPYATLSSYSTATNVAKDLVLFEHDRTRFFRLLAIFCGGQLLFWTYLAHFAFTGLRDTRSGTNEPQNVRTELGLFSFDMNLGSNAWRFGFTLACLAVGGGIVGLGVLFCRRSVSRVILHKGGGKVTVSTQSPLGPDRGRSMTVPLGQVTCHAHRQESPSFIPLKVKGHKFYFLLDKEGTLNNPKLFDITVGAYRTI